MSGAKQSRRRLVADALPGNPADIAASTKLARTTVWRWLKAMHQDGECHVAKWMRNPQGGPFLPVYAAGPGVDAVCALKPLTEKQKSRRYRAAARRDGRWEDRNARVRARWRADHADYQRDPLMAWIPKSEPA